MYRSNRDEPRHRGNLFSHITIDQVAAADQKFPVVCERLSCLAPKYGKWKSYRRARTRLVVADRYIPYDGGHDIFPGQVCIALETAGIGAGKRFDGFHVVRYWDPEVQRTVERVAHVQRIVGGRHTGSYRLYWGQPQGALVVERAEVTFVASVIGMYAGDEAPVLWMYAN